MHPQGIHKAPSRRPQGSRKDGVGQGAWQANVKDEDESQKSCLLGETKRAKRRRDTFFLRHKRQRPAATVDIMRNTHFNDGPFFSRGKSFKEKQKDSDMNSDTTASSIVKS